VATNLVSPVLTRFPKIRPELLPPMAVLQSIDTEKIIRDRMQELISLWQAADPPNAAQYDVSNLEFDPIKINQELNAFFELMLRDRVNQACRAVTLAFSVGSDLDAIGSRYPYGVPRKSIANGDSFDETDDQYRTRLWLSPSIFSLNGPGQGTFESYVFWAMSAPMFDGEWSIKHASAMTKAGTGYVYIPIISSKTDNPGLIWDVSPDGNVWTLAPGTQPMPTSRQIEAVYEYITAPGTARKGLTDVISVMAPKPVITTIDIDMWLFPGVDKPTLMRQTATAFNDLVTAMRWLGSDLTILSIDGALTQAGVYDRTLISPKEDLIVGPDGIVVITSVRLRYRGTGE
jgi:phage-related baseplate assembly protein